MSTQEITVNFHGSDLFIIDYNGEPYTPMKAIVEGMGLDWSGQLAKLNANPERWGMEKIPIPTIGYLQEAVCLPLRKLSGWLSTISPNKVKSHLREKILFYQNECDDVLWKHWSQKKPVEQQLTITFPEALRLLADKTEAEEALKLQVETQQEEIAILEPKADALDRLENSDGSLNVTEASKVLKVKRDWLFSYLHSLKWIYRRVGSTNWLGYTDKEQQGLVKNDTKTVKLADGTEKITVQVRITSKGLAKLSLLLNNGGVK